LVEISEWVDATKASDRSGHGGGGRMFRLNRLTDYGVVVLTQICLSNNGLCSAQQISRRTGVPLPTVSKVLNILTRDGLVESHRGATGGYALSRRPDEIAVADIIQALEGPIALTACVDSGGGNCEVESICPMRGGWDKVNRAIRDALNSVSLADMIGGAWPLGGDAEAGADGRAAAAALARGAG
jgi:FeS assembly SUF system regulator